MKIGHYVILLSVLLVLAEAKCSFSRQTFLPTQVMARWRTPGIPLGCHGGFWGDLFLLPSFFWGVVNRHDDEWSLKQVITMGVIGFVITLANHLNLVTHQNVPDPYGWQKEKWSPVIALNFVYMTTYVALAGLFYFCSPSVSVFECVLISFVLGVHMTFGVHIPLGLLNLDKEFNWCPDLINPNKVLVMSLAIWVTLAMLSLSVSIEAAYHVWTFGIIIAAALALLTLTLGKGSK